MKLTDLLDIYWFLTKDLEKSILIKNIGFDIY